MSTPNPFSQPSFLPTHAIDYAFAGIGAGTVAVLCMNPLDLLKVKFQVSTRGPEGGIGRGIWRALRDIHASEGWRGLYRGLSSNVAGNAGSWGLYFLFYNQLKRRATRVRILFFFFPQPPTFLTLSQGAVTAILTNPIWVVYVLWSGFRAIFSDEGWAGLYRGTSLALVGVSNGAPQFMAYEKMKSWAFERKRRRV
ncbi:mitochondrial carrier domain-containing protein [Lactarius akahatsu]|uniref:Mitochondrial carrier domain-containing protein n=1 Tax=Lactarius akahatsu TaxID=416441 RepID=A0AAD4Q7P4_9AGAM|nr:mitochondrial carrier domain-containing protein [Lactarius akahatsu]